MKKYITPTIECSSFVGAMLMYTTSDGNGSAMTSTSPNPGEGGGGPKNARVF